jgi:hypothetical protein
VPYPLPALARAAYAAGWAISGGPLTGRVHAGCVAAVRTVMQHPDRPGVLEVALRLGHLEGVWAIVYRRREQQIRAHTSTMTGTWRGLAARLPVEAEARDLLRRLRMDGLTETSSAQRRDAIRADAATAARLILAGLPETPAWALLRQQMREALTAGRAEGIVAAIAVAAARIDKAGLDWDSAYQSAYDSLLGLDRLWVDADGWLRRMLDRATADLGRALADAAMTGGGYPDLVGAASAVLGSDDVDAVSFVTDWALTTAQAAAARDVYRSQGVSSLDWLDAADGHVCADCSSNADQSPYSPYSPDTLPFMPAHPGCRCSIAPSTDAVVDVADYASWFTNA